MAQSLICQLEEQHQDSFSDDIDSFSSVGMSNGLPIWIFTDPKSKLFDEEQVDDQVSSYTQSTNDCSRILEMLAPDSKFDFLDDSTDEK